MELRKAQAGDVAAIAALWHAGWHQAHGAIVPAALVASRVPAEFEARVAKRVAQTEVARIGGQLAGFYILDQDELYQFYVDAAFQGQGVAGQMMAHVEQALRGRMAWLACSQGNDRAAAFYTKAGWSKGGEEAYPVETSGGMQEVTIWRFTKDLRR